MQWQLTRVPFPVGLNSTVGSHRWITIHKSTNECKLWYAITLLQYHKQETWGYATRETAFTITFISNALKGTFLQFFFTWNAGWEIRCRPAEQLCNVCCACRGALSNQWQQRPIMSSDYVSTWPLQSGQGVLKWEFWPGGEGVSCNLHSPPPKKDINYKPKLSV